MFATGNRAVVVLLILACAAPAQEVTAEDAPAIHQGKPHFYNAIGGRNFAVKWSANPTALPADPEFTLTLVLTDVANPARVRRPDLSANASFKAAFRQIIPIGEPIVGPKSVSFAYRLRPRDETVQEVPELEYAYFSPAKNDTATKYVDALPLKVIPAAVAPAVAIPLDAPERFFHIPIQTEAPANPGLEHWLGLLATLVAAGVAGVALARWRNPDGRRLARVRRNRAVRNVLDAIAHAPQAADPLAHAVNALRRYFAVRHGLLTIPTSAGELEAAFEASGVPAGKVAAAVELFRTFDAARFGGGSDSALSLVAQARDLVLTWEGVA